MGAGMPLDEREGLRNSWHFAEASTIPVMDATTPVRSVFAKLHRAGAAGFVLAEGPVPQYYVKGLVLAQSITEAGRARVQGIEALADAAVGELVTGSIGLPARVRIGQRPVDVATAETELRVPDERVFEVVVGGRRVGWYLNHESIRLTTTGKIWWKCTNGHLNPDPDRGSCYQCPGKIVGPEQDT